MGTRFRTIQPIVPSGTRHTAVSRNYLLPPLLPWRGPNGPFGRRLMPSASTGRRGAGVDFLGVRIEWRVFFIDASIIGAASSVPQIAHHWASGSLQRFSIRWLIGNDPRQRHTAAARIP